MDITWQIAFILFANIQFITCHSTSVERDFFENQFVLGEERPNGRNAMKSPENKWPNGIVPYHFGEEYIERDKAAVLHAMEVFRAKTCIKFVLKRDHHSQYIIFKKSKSGCGTLVGYKSEPIDVSLTEKCLTLTGAIQHEILHTLGIWHEQSRPDRDEFVEILWDNIQPDHKHNFEKKDNDLVETFDLPYDYDSLMHYPNDAFVKPGKNATIISKKDPNRKLGQLDEPSQQDIDKVRKMYNCGQW